MTVSELKHLMKIKDIPNFLIFTGDEYYVQRAYIEQIAKVRGLKINYIDSITDVWGSLNTKSFLSVNYLYVVRDDKELMTNEKIYSRLEEVLSDNMLIALATSVDNRLKVYKQYKSSLVEFEALKSEILKNYIKRDIDLSDRNCEILMEVTSYNYGHCLLEIDKIKKCMHGTDADDMPNNIFEMMLADGTIYIPPKDRLWDFIKAFLQDKPKVAYDYYQDLKELGTPTFAILTNLYNNARAIFQVQTCNSSDVAKTTGLTAWQIRNANDCKGKISSNDLAYLMRLIQKAESYIKSGKLDEQIAIDYVFVNFF